MSNENIDYRAIVERMAEILHSSVTDIPLLTVTAQSYKDRLAKVEAERDTLAAENAALNEKMNTLATWPDIEFYSSSWEFNNGDGNDALEFMCDVQTPATDAFLREVMAQGVEAFADSKYCQEESQSGAHEFAAELRQGGAA